MFFQQSEADKSYVDIEDCTLERENLQPPISCPQALPKYVQEDSTTIDDKHDSCKDAKDGYGAVLFNPWHDCESDGEEYEILGPVEGLAPMISKELTLGECAETHRFQE